MYKVRRFAAVLLLSVIGCNAPASDPPPCAPPTSTDLATVPAADMATAPDLISLPTGAGPGARCVVESDCDGIATSSRYCATDIEEPSGARGYCIEAIQVAAGAYHVYFGDPGLAGDGGVAYCDMSGLAVGVLPHGSFLCGLFSVR